MRTAITGPARELSEKEKAVIRRALAREWRQDDELYSGGALGVDTVAALQAGRVSHRLVIIAPADRYYNNSLDQFADEIIRVEGDYMDRNDRLSELADVLIAFPETAKEERRSGTWATIRRFRKLGKPVVLYPLDGSQDRQVSLRSKLETRSNGQLVMA